MTQVNRSEHDMWQQISAVCSTTDMLDIAERLNVLEQMCRERGLKLADVYSLNRLPRELRHTIGIEVADHDEVIACGLCELDVVVVLRAAEPTTDAWGRPVEAARFYCATPQQASERLP